MFSAQARCKDLPPESISIEKAVELALKNNTSVIDSQYVSEIYDAQINEYKSYAYPSLTLSGGYTRNLKKQSFFMMGQKIDIGNDNAYTGTAQMDQVLWSGGKVKAGIKYAELLSQSGKFGSEIARKLVARNVRQIGYSIIAASAAVTIERETYDLAAMHRDEIKEKFEKGLASDVEVDRQEVEVSNHIPAVIQSENLVETGLLTLNTLLGRDPQDPILITDKVHDILGPEPDLDALYAAALENRTEIKSAKLAVDLSETKVRLAKSDFFPQFYGFLNGGYNGQSNTMLPGAQEYSFSSAAGLTLNYPIFQSGRTQAQVKQADLAYQQKFENYQDTIRKVKSEVKQAWLDYREAVRRVNSQKKSAEQARKVVTAYNVQYLQGLASQLELNDSTLALNKAQLNYVTALRDAFTSLVEIKWAAGE